MNLKSISKFRIKYKLVIGFFLCFILPIIIEIIIALIIYKIRSGNVSVEEIVFRKNLTYLEVLKSWTIIILVGSIPSTIILIYWFYKSFTYPLTQINIIMSNIKNGDLNTSVKVNNKNKDVENVLKGMDSLRLELKKAREEKLFLEEEHRKLISNISHDLKTPMTIIKGYSEGILDGICNNEEKLNHYLKTINKKTEEMDNLLGELVFYSNMDSHIVSLDLMEINAYDFFTEAVYDIEDALLEEKVKFTSSIDIDKKISINIDSEKIKRVIWNIISNGLKYKDSTKNENYISFKVYKDEKYINVSIEDNGRGIEKNDLNKVFTRFFRCDKSRNTNIPGSGLGLSIVKEIIEEHNGFVCIDSEENKKTEVIFKLKYKE